MFISGGSPVFYAGIISKFRTPHSAFRISQFVNSVDRRDSKSVVIRCHPLNPLHPCNVISVWYGGSIEPDCCKLNFISDGQPLVVAFFFV